MVAEQESVIWILGLKWGSGKVWQLFCNWMWMLTILKIYFDCWLMGRSAVHCVELGQEHVNEPRVGRQREMAWE